MFQLITLVSSATLIPFTLKHNIFTGPRAAVDTFGVGWGPSSASHKSILSILLVLEYSSMCTFLFNHHSASYCMDGYNVSHCTVLPPKRYLSCYHLPFLGSKNDESYSFQYYCICIFIFLGGQWMSFIPAPLLPLAWAKVPWCPHRPWPLSFLSNLRHIGEWEVTFHFYLPFLGFYWEWTCLHTYAVHPRFLMCDRVAVMSRLLSRPWCRRPWHWDLVGGPFALTESPGLDSPSTSYSRHP